MPEYRVHINPALASSVADLLGCRDRSAAARTLAGIAAAVETKRRDMTDRADDHGEEVKRS